jgi:uncharacterized protein (TIGR03437 family)
VIALPIGRELNCLMQLDMVLPDARSSQRFPCKCKPVIPAAGITLVLFAWLVVVPASAQTQTYTESVIYNFCPNAYCLDGLYPNGVIQGSDGNFYGTTIGGGSGNLNNCNAGSYTGLCGTVFKITPSGVLTTLHSFCTQGGANCTDGFLLVANLVEGSDDNFYGTTAAGGSSSSNCVASGCGTVFRITPTGVFSTLYSFCAQGGANCPDGFNPWANLVEGSDGNFYGTTLYGGVNGEGTVFKITPSGSLTTLYNFCSQSSGSAAIPSNCADGAQPEANLILGSDGNLYGSTINGGAFSVGGRFGTIFKITPSGSLTTLYSFCTPNCETGFAPVDLFEDSDGNFYGATSEAGNFAGNATAGAGTIFKLTPSGAFSLLYSFCIVGNCLDGSYPTRVLQGSDSNFYGVTAYGGASNNGTAFKLTPSGTLTTLYNFCSQGGAACTDGAFAIGLLQGSDGNFYGTADGGANGWGVVFKLSVSPAEPILGAGTLANGATYLAGGLVPGSWAQVKGTDLSNTTRIWGAPDFVGLGNSLPTNLSGVQVMVNNQPAAVYYISPGQISFQVPSAVSGTASVQVIDNGVASNTLTAAAATNSPGIFPVIENGINYPAGVFLDGLYVGDPSVSPAFRNATPGDVIQLYATGLAPTPAGVLPVAQSVSGVTVTIGPVTVPADFAGLVAVGEFQINFTVPQQFANEPAGAYPISIQVNGVSSPTTINSNPPSQLVLPIQPQPPALTASKSSVPMPIPR